MSFCEQDDDVVVGDGDVPPCGAPNRQGQEIGHLEAAPGGLIHLRETGRVPLATFRNVLLSRNPGLVDGAHAGEPLRALRKPAETDRLEAGMQRDCHRGGRHCCGEDLQVPMALQQRQVHPQPNVPAAKFRRNPRRAQLVPLPRLVEGLDRDVTDDLPTVQGDDREPQLPEAIEFLWGLGQQRLDLFAVDLDSGFLCRIGDHGEQGEHGEHGIRNHVHVCEPVNE